MVKSNLEDKVRISNLVTAQKLNITGGKYNGTRSNKF